MFTDGLGTIVVEARGPPPFFFLGEIQNGNKSKAVLITCLE
jgi:hypothetical protein